MRKLIYLILLFFSFNVYCQKITKRDFKRQSIDNKLIAGKWTLSEISSTNFSRSAEEIGNQPSVFLTFAEHGILRFSFVNFDRTFEGRFLQKGSTFTYFHSGINEKVLWTDGGEGSNNGINPNMLALKLNLVISSYTISDNTLTLFMTGEKGFVRFRR